MANKYAGTQTEKNLEAAFAGESQARNKYTYFASKAKKEGFEQISALFLKTADNEKEHAKMWFKELEGIGSTADWKESAAQRRTWPRRLRARTTNGPTCTRGLPKRRRQKDLRNWLPNSVWWLPLKSIMKNAIARC